MQYIITQLIILIIVKNKAVWARLIRLILNWAQAIRPSHKRRKGHKTNNQNKLT